MDIPILYTELLIEFMPRTPHRSCDPMLPPESHSELPIEFLNRIFICPSHQRKKFDEQIEIKFDEKFETKFDEKFETKFDEIEREIR